MKEAQSVMVRRLLVLVVLVVLLVLLVLPVLVLMLLVLVLETTQKAKEKLAVDARIQRMLVR